MQEALFYSTQAADQVKCHLCPTACILAPGQIGRCQARRNQEGTLYSLNYAQVAAFALDPMEKKPLYHFYPGSSIFSLGTIGCNFACQFCQNWALSQGESPTQELLPEAAVQLMRKISTRENCIGLAFTYAEPLVWYEYVLETAELVQNLGLKTVLVTNGSLQPQPFQEMLTYIDALNIDLKAFNPNFYQRWCKGQLAPVLHNVELASQANHLELTTLLIPGLNDSAAEIKALAKWIAQLNPNIPLHLSRYYPNYQMDYPPTPVETMEQAFEIARAELNYVYLGNLPGHQGNNTLCPRCNHLLIQRVGYQTQVLGVKDHCCANCQEPIPVFLLPT